MVAVALRKDLARSIRRGHPWVYRGALAARPDLEDGAEVLVTTRDGRPLASGFWDARSPIAVRILASPPARGLPVLVERRIAEALARRTAVIDRSRTDAFRWVHGEADLLPGIHVDLYRDVAAVRFDGGGARAFYRGLPAVLAAAGAAIPVRAVVERSSGGRGGGRRAPAAILSGRLPDGEIEVTEDGLRFGVDLLAGEKGGLFLDQRDNRRAIAALARGRSVLDLFAYTGGFSVHAASGGASRTVTVDAAREAVAAARRNFARNRLSLARADFHVADVFDFLTAAARRGDLFDVVICDPPSFAPSRRALPAARRAYSRLHRLAARVAAPGGILCAASCSSHYPRAELRRSVAAAVAAAGRRFVLVEERGAGPDHPVIPSFPEGDYLKLLVGRVSEAAG